MYMTKRKNDKALDQLIKDARIDDLKAALPDKDNSLYMGYLRDLLYHPASFLQQLRLIQSIEP